MTNLDKIKQIAQVCHEANRAFCQTLGDMGQVAWEDAPQWQQASAMASVHFVLHNPDAPPAALHDAWMDQKIQDGWKLGPVKDATKKEHPWMVPFSCLPKDQQLKDTLFLAVVKALNSVG